MMRRTVLFMMMVCSMTFTLSSCIYFNAGYGSIGMAVGNGIIKNDDRGKMEFTAIKTSGSVDVVISKDSDGSVVVSGDENLVADVETDVRDGVLYVRYRKAHGYNSKLGLRVTVPNSGRIGSITASGAADVLAESLLTAGELRISCSGSSDFKGDIKASVCELNFSGSSDFKGNIEAAECNIHCSGSSDCAVSGMADVCKILASGSCDFAGYGFTVRKCNLMASGASDIQITCNEELTAQASGASSISYKGTARTVRKVSSGASDITHK